MLEPSTPSPKRFMRKRFATADAATRAGMIAELMIAEAEQGRFFRPGSMQGIVRDHTEDALRAADLVLEKDPLHTVALTWRAAILNRQGDFPAATRGLRAVLKARLPRNLRRRAVDELRRLDLMSPSSNQAWRERLWRIRPGEEGSLKEIAYAVQRRISEGRDPDAGALEAAIAERTEQVFAALPPGKVRTALERLRGASSVALVGSGPSVIGRGCGEEIDAHDVVVRFNFPNVTGFEADVGTRTDLVMFTGTHRPALPERMAREPCYAVVPALGFDMDNAKEARLDPPPVPAPLNETIQHISYYTGTTGFRTIILAAVLLQLPTSLYGFDFFAGGRPGHYFGKMTAFLHHEVGYERWLVRTALPVLRPDLHFPNDG